MVQKETISFRDQEDRTKFYEFHELLEELFPTLHAKCEKHVFDGSLLFKWSGTGKEGPILLMSHHDVVEANGTNQNPEDIKNEAIEMVKYMMDKRNVKIKELIVEEAHHTVKEIGSAIAAVIYITDDILE